MNKKALNINSTEKSGLMIESIIVTKNQKLQARGHYRPMKFMLL